MFFTLLSRCFNTVYHDTYQFLSNQIRWDSNNNNRVFEWWGFSSRWLYWGRGPAVPFACDISLPWTMLRWRGVDQCEFLNNGGWFCIFSCKTVLVFVKLWGNKYSLQYMMYDMQQIKIVFRKAGSVYCYCIIRFCCLIV